MLPMDLQTAHTTLTSITQIVATLVGLLVIAVVFYLERSASFHSKTRWIRDAELIVGSYYVFFQWLEIIMLLFALLVPLIFGLSLIFGSEVQITKLPSNEGTLNPNETEDVLARVREFRRFLFAFSSSIGGLLFLGFALPRFESELEKERDRYGKLTGQIMNELRNELSFYFQEVVLRLGLTGALQDLRTQLTKNHKSELYVRLYRRLEHELCVYLPDKTPKKTKTSVMIRHIANGLLRWAGTMRIRSSSSSYEKLYVLLQGAFADLSNRLRKHEIGKRERDKRRAVLGTKKVLIEELLGRFSAGDVN